MDQDMLREQESGAFEADKQEIEWQQEGKKKKKKNKKKGKEDEENTTQ